MKKRLIWIIGVATILTACNSEVSDNPPTHVNEEHKATSNLEITNFLMNERPPALTITIGEQTIKTSLGSHSWSYTDEKTGQQIAIETESLSPTEIVSLENAKLVDFNMPINLNFEQQPDRYDIRIWSNENKITATYRDLSDIKEKGKIVCEILATWEQGKASYSFALDIQ